MKLWILALLSIILLVEGSIHVSVNVKEEHGERHMKPTAKPHYQNHIQPPVIHSNAVEADLDEAQTSGSYVSTIAKSLKDRFKSVPLLSYIEVMFDGKTMGTSHQAGSKYIVPFSVPYHTIDVYLLCNNPSDIIQLLPKGNGESYSMVYFKDPTYEQLVQAHPIEQWNYPYTLTKPVVGTIPSKFNQNSYKVTIEAPNNAMNHAYDSDMSFSFSCKAQVGTRSSKGFVVIHPSEKSIDLKD